MVKIVERFFSEPFTYFQIGFSVKGKGKEENQDNFEFFNDDNCVIAVIADGLGSVIYSSHGSKLLCTATIDILKQAESTPDLALKIREKWLENIHHKPAACDTTMKFVKISREKAIIGGIGDGWIAFLSEKEYISLIAENSFANQTDTIMSSDLISKFVTKEIILGDECGLFIMATDGFSEDIDKIQGKKFLETINASLETDMTGFCDDLETTLNTWPVRTSSDDKTVVILKRGLR
jgi:serine/threonine protein phosphatase PrpC